MSRLSAKKVAAELRRTRGMVAVAARSLGCNRSTVYDYIRKYASVREARDEAREFTTDTAELKLYEAIQAGDPWAVQFYLKTQGKDRGYTERTELQHSGALDVSSLSDEELEAIARGDVPS